MVDFSKLNSRDKLLYLILSSAVAGIALFYMQKENVVVQTEIPPKENKSYNLKLKGTLCDPSGNIIIPESDNNILDENNNKVDFESTRNNEVLLKFYKPHNPESIIPLSIRKKNSRDPTYYKIHYKEFQQKDNHGYFKFTCDNCEQSSNKPSTQSSNEPSTQSSNEPSTQSSSRSSTQSSSVSSTQCPVTLITRGLCNNCQFDQILVDGKEAALIGNGTRCKAPLCGGEMIVFMNKGNVTHQAVYQK